MYTMYIKINNKEINKDGIKHDFPDLKSIVLGIEGYNVDRVSIGMDGNTEYVFSTKQFGVESYLISILEEIPYFLKYVIEWNTDDDGLVSNMIDVEREMGVQCAYAAG